MTPPISIDPKEFRNALGAFTTGVTVVTTVAQSGEDIGLTANSFNSVSLDPPMVLWSLAKSSLSLPAFKDAEHFAVHILALEQEGLSGTFASRGVDKFGGLTFDRGPDNVPLLRDCAARFVCRTVFQYEGGDHIIFVGEVIEFEHWARSPLLFHAGQYGQIVKREKGSSANDKNEIPQEFVGELLRRAYGQLYAPVKKEYEKRNISAPQYFYLSRVAQHNKPSSAFILDLLSEIGRRPTEQEIIALFERELVEEVDGVLHLTESGNQLNLELASVIKSVETDAEEGLDFTLRQTLTMALQQLIRSRKQDS